MRVSYICYVRGFRRHLFTLAHSPVCRSLHNRKLTFDVPFGMTQSDNAVRTSALWVQSADDGTPFPQAHLQPQFQNQRLSRIDNNLHLVEWRYIANLYRYAIDPLRAFDNVGQSEDLG